MEISGVNFAPEQIVLFSGLFLLACVLSLAFENANTSDLTAPVRAIKFKLPDMNDQARIDEHCSAVGFSEKTKCINAVLEGEN